MNVAISTCLKLSKFWLKSLYIKIESIPLLLLNSISDTILLIHTLDFESLSSIQMFPNLVLE